MLDSILVGVKTPTESHHDCGLATCRARPAIFQDPRWHDIRAYQVNDPASKLRAAFKYKRTNAFVPSRTAPDSSLSQTGEDDRSLEQLFFPLQTWTSWQYRRAYPKLFEYVRKGTLNEELQCEVLFEDFLFDEHEASLAEWPSTDILLRNIVKDRNKKDRLRLRRGKGPIDLEDFWNQVKSRFKERKVPKNPPTSTNTSPETESRWIIPCRALRVIDLTPGVTRVILGSTPMLELSYMAPFFERYLTSQNWAKANLIVSPGDDTMLKTYQLEYHLSFYCVPPASKIHNLHIDARGLRHVSHFTAGPGAGTKHECRQICEEQLSFLIVGHGRDVYTNVQLAERYYNADDDADHASQQDVNAPLGTSFFVRRGKPCSTFLAWIATSLRHVVGRWSVAIDAVDTDIESPFEVVFDGDRYSLLSDDSSFSRSKKYLWAVQVYKVFENKLEKTIAVWDEFEEHSLAKLDHKQIDHHEESLDTIHWAIEELRTRLSHIRSKREEVTNLRDGLFSTSQLLDSRISVRQNDNIKLLTYINLLFLPLSFCTSIFGMQTILPSGLHINAFVITICSVTVFTAFLVFNLQLMSELMQQATSGTTTWFRNRMQHHHQRVWHKTEEALRNDRDARHIPTQNRLRKSTHWMYFLFVLQFLFLTIPVHEIEARHHVWGLKPDVWRWHINARHTKLQEDLDAKATEFNYMTEDGHKNRRAKRALKRSFGREILKTGALLMLAPFRILLLPWWALLASFAVIVVWVFILLRDALSPQRPPMQKGMLEKTRPSCWARAKMHLGLQKDEWQHESMKQNRPVYVRPFASHWLKKARKSKMMKKASKKVSSWKTNRGVPHTSLDATMNLPRPSVSSPGNRNRTSSQTNHVRN